MSTGKLLVFRIRRGHESPWGGLGLVAFVLRVLWKAVRNP